jgi:hypothetical protein
MRTPPGVNLGLIAWNRSRRPSVPAARTGGVARRSTRWNGRQSRCPRAQEVEGRRGAGLEKRQRKRQLRVGHVRAPTRRPRFARAIRGARHLKLFQLPSAFQRLRGSQYRPPGGGYACTTHERPYEPLGDAWARFMGEWFPGSGHRLRDGGSYEIYRNTPASVPLGKLETELRSPSCRGRHDGALHRNRARDPDRGGYDRRLRR